jgi:23S rRNA pseudouridine2605 synthase
MAAGSLIRLQKILSTAGVASRRASERLMAEGRVSVNGETITELGRRADPEHDDIRVDGRRIRIAGRRLYLLLNKPRGYVTTRSDPEGRPTVLDLLPGVREYLYPVGRLDYDSEGLLILTNDGELAARLMHPRHEFERVYEAEVRGVPDDRALAHLVRGIVLDGRRTAPAKVRLLAPHPSARVSERPCATIEITVHEGRSRQVRKMCEAVGHPVARLRRVRFGPIADRGLKAGSFRALTADELKLLRVPTDRRQSPASSTWKFKGERRK